MLDKVKAALRVKTTAFDDEVQGLIDACKADLRLVGVNVPEDQPKAVHLRRVILLSRGRLSYTQRQTSGIATIARNTAPPMIT